MEEDAVQPVGERVFPVGCVQLVFHRGHEVPAADFRRTIDFYESVFGVELPVCECEQGKMAYFMEGEKAVGAINCDNMDGSLQKILRLGGGIVIPRTKIEAEDMGYFAVCADSEGNHIGLYAEK